MTRPSSLGAAVGLIRLPDLFSRLHAATKATSLGMIGMLTAVVLLTPAVDTGIKALVALLFQVLTAPVSAHVIGRAAYRVGIHHGAEVDELGQTGVPDGPGEGPGGW